LDLKNNETNILRDIKFLNENTGWAIDSGTILKSTDGGETSFYNQVQHLVIYFQLIL
jgi:photosystem II stability/assembly factor-like uncharacterized protein